MVSSFFSKQRSIIAVVCIAVLVVALSLAVGGCGKASIVGKWEDPTDKSITEFKADGTIVTATVEGTYTLEDGNMTISVGGAVFFATPYTLDGDKLTVNQPADNKPVTLTRVK